MKWTLLILIFLASGFPATRMLTGTVSLDNEPLRGCHVKVLGNGFSQFTDSKGQFRINIDGLAELSVLISYVDRLTCKVQIENIRTDENDINLGQIPLFFNETVKVSEYETFDESKKKEYEEVRHWTKLIGYMNRMRVDTIALRTTLTAKRNIKYRFDSLDNTIVITYPDWK